MAAYLFKAVDAKGANSSGVIEAASPAAARQELRSRRLLPLSVEPTKKSANLTATPGRETRTGRIGQRALVIITRQLATLIGAGIRVEDALRTVADQAANRKVATLLLNIRAAVLDGQSFAAALAEHPQVFGNYYRASVRAGEASGQLNAVMQQLADFVERRGKNQRTVRLALLYPSLLATVSIGVIVSLLVFVVPDIVRVFETRGAELPFLTRSLIAISDGMASYGLLALMVMGGAAFLWLWGMSQPAFRLRVHKWLAETRPFSGFVLKANSVQFAGTLSTLIVSQVPLTEALDAAASSISNLRIRQSALQVAESVREGTSLSVAMRDARTFPPLLVAMVASGEAGGTLGASLTRAADDQARDFDAFVAALVALIEPAVLLVMGGLVMLLVMSILLPIVNLNNLVG